MEIIIAYVVFASWCWLAYTSDRQFERKFRAEWRTWMVSRNRK